ncbi:MAG: phosphatase PAP2 family protein [Bacteroidales bacterium]|nr:phosphatase PAP2 family protein [Bacteroidales bacterium]
MHKHLLSLLLVLTLTLPTQAQRDSLQLVPISTSAGLMASGVALHYVPTLNTWNTSLQDAMQQWRQEGPLQGQPTHIDNYLQYAPVVSLFALKICGVPSRDDYLPLAALTAEAYLCMALLTNAGKYGFGILRPDGSAHNSFPSGHTATAFCGAELMRIEYHKVSPWIGVGAYSLATLTGLMRIYNNRHWTADVLAGAGVGILSAQIANYINGLIFRPKRDTPSSYSPLSINHTLQ